MSESIDGIEGSWQRREVRVVKDGEHFRFGGQWNGSNGISLDLTRAFKPSTAVLDEHDYLEVFVPAVDTPALPTEDGVYADCDGDLWRLYNEKWLYLAGDFNTVDDAHNYTPLRLVAPLYGNFENQEY